MAAPSMPRLGPVPEVLEVELTRRRGRARWSAVGSWPSSAPTPLVVGAGVDDAVVGATIEGFDRRGKVLGRAHRRPDDRAALRDDRSAAARRHGRRPRAPGVRRRSSDDARWDRWVVRLDDGSRLRFHDPRRLGRVWLEPDLDGPRAGRADADARASWRRRCAGRRAPVKAVLLDQAAVAGLGNMLVDEVLWWAGIDPHRPAGVAGARRGRRAAAGRSVAGFR